MKPSPQQIAFIHACATTSESLTLDSVAGSGKCLGRDTPILLSHGDTALVQNIQPGDYLAGPNEPRQVLSTTQGKGELVKIQPTKGAPWICNTDHILTLAGTNRFRGAILDISVKDYEIACAVKKSFKAQWKLWRTPINYWPAANVPYDPYLIGLWIGDGASGEATFTTADAIIKNYLYRMADFIDYEVKEKYEHSSIPGLGHNENCWNLRLTPKGSTRQNPQPSPLRQYLRSLPLNGEKRVPPLYLRSSQAHRLQLLAGLLDSDGSLGVGTFEFTTKWFRLADDVCFLARSLGLAAYSAIHSVNGYPYERVTISGDCSIIPTKLPHKQAAPRQQIKRVNVTGFKIKHIGSGEFFGFTLDGDGRFLLGDFTVTHNTSTLALGSHKLAGQGRATSFSKPTVTELSRAMSSSFPARTMHGDGLDAIKASIGKVQVDKANNKVFTFTKDAAKEADLPWQAGQAAQKLVDQAQTAGIVPEHSKFLLPDTPSNWEALADQYDIEYSPQIQQIARRALLHSNQQVFETKQISFNDMLYIPLFFPMRMKQHKTIIVDEAQDLSPIQHALLRKQLRPGGRIIAAGDEHQAIFGFRGAMSNSYDALAQEFSAKRLSLTVSFRCPQAVVQEAQKYVPEMEAAPNAPYGDVIEHQHMEITKLPQTILCRNNAPLVKLALRLLLQGITAEVAGKDIGAGLVSLTKRLATGKQSDHMKSLDFYARVERWADREIARSPRKKPAIQDKKTVFETLCLHHDTLGAIRHHLLTLYVNPNDNRRLPAQHYLTTIHKSKGLQWPEVLFLDPFLLPAKWAVQDWEIQQEMNLSYVGITRAQSILHYCNSEGLN